MLHSPTLNTILMVEKTLRQKSDSVITIAQLKKKLPRKVNHNTVMSILEYLEQSNKIAVSLKGITWIHSSSKQLKAAISQGIEL